MIFSLLSPEKLEVDYLLINKRIIGGHCQLLN